MLMFLFMPFVMRYLVLPICVTLVIISLMDSKGILRKTIELIATRGYRVGNIDATVCAERPKINPHIPAMCKCLAEIIGCDEDAVSIKATTSERMGFVGREEGMAAYAVCLIVKA